MQIQQTDTGKEGKFIITDASNIAGTLLYKWSGKDKIIIEHTEIDDAYSGQGLGKKLVLEAVSFARQKHIKILPWCTYAKSVFDKTPEIKDVLF